MVESHMEVEKELKRERGQDGCSDLKWLQDGADLLSQQLMKNQY